MEKALCLCVSVSLCLLFVPTSVRAAQKFQALDQRRVFEQRFLLHAPGRKQVAKQPWLRLLPVVLDQGLRRVYLVPTGRQHAKAFLQKDGDRRISVALFIMPGT